MRDPHKRAMTALRSALRRWWLFYSPGRKAAWLAAKRAGGWECAECHKVFRGKDVAVDHKVPCGTLKCAADIGPFVERLMVGPEGLQVLDKDGCHLRKTQEERRLRCATQKCPKD